MNPTTEFWKYFQEVSDDLVREEETSLRKLYLQLTKIDVRLYLHTGRKDNGEWDLILSAEGIPELMPVIADLVKAAPVVSGWRYLPCYDGIFLFGERSEELYPDNINGDTLYKMACDGDKPWISREVDFSVVFPDENSADKFLSEINREGVRFKKSPYAGAEGFSFQVELTRNMCPTYSGITAFEEKIAAMAGALGGRNDGWGCFQVNDDKQNSPANT